MKRIVLLAVLAVVALTLCVAPLAVADESPTPTLYGESAGASPAGEAVYRLGTTEGYDGFNPFAHWSGPTWDTFRLCYNFLTWYDTGLQGRRPTLRQRVEHVRRTARSGPSRSARA